MIKKYMDLIFGFLMIFYFLLINSMSLLRFKYIFLVLGFLCIFYHFIKKYLDGKNKVYKFIRKVFIIALALFFMIEGCMIFYPKKNLKNDCDYIIVLGALVNKNQISKSLQDRLDTCIDYLDKSEDDCYIVVSGGQGRGEIVTEASAMKKYLVSKGVSDDLILMEDKSTTTKENFVFSKKLIEQKSSKKIENLNIKIITTDFHTLRSKLISYRAGYKNTSFYTSKSSYYLYVLNYTREFFALICNVIFNY